MRWEEQIERGWVDWYNQRINWRTVGYLRQGESQVYDYRLKLPEPLASWDVWDYWEREAIESMREHLTSDDVLFEIGAEQGWMSCVLAEMCQIVLIEPTAAFWPNIRWTWEANRSDMPLFAWRGLIGEKTDRASYPTGWPAESEGLLSAARSYTYLHDNDGCPVSSLDDFVAASGIIPTALQIDVEGAEIEVLRGAGRTLRKYRPKIWLSLHPDLIKRDYGADATDVLALLGDHGYRLERLSVDHEQHWYCR